MAGNSYDDDFITFTPAKLKEFKAVYEQTKDAGKETFTFDGREVLVAYAKYMIEHLNQQFREHTNDLR